MRLARWSTLPVRPRYPYLPIWAVLARIPGFLNAAVVDLNEGKRRGVFLTSIWAPKGHAPPIDLNREHVTPSFVDSLLG
jgi:hypothetical protein